MTANQMAVLKVAAYQAMGLLVGCILLFGFCVIMTRRHLWVIRHSIELQWRDPERYKDLPSQGVMVMRFWVRDFNKFLPGESPETKD